MLFFNIDSLIAINENEYMITDRRTGLPTRVLFIVLLFVLIIPSGIFIYLSYTRLDDIMMRVSSDNFISYINEVNPKDFDDIDKYQAYAMVELERGIVKVRQHRTQIYVLTRTWMRFMSLIFGSIMIVIGSAFVLGRVNGPVTKGELSLKDIGFSIISSSPGILLALLGTVLIAIPNTSTQYITTDDTSTYINAFVIDKASSNLSAYEDYLLFLNELDEDTKEDNKDGGT